MNVFSAIFLIGVSIVMVRSIIDFIRGDKFHYKIKLKESRFSTEIFYTLLVIYCIVITGFGLIYFILSFQGVILVEHGKLKDVNIIGSLIHSFYFSGVTLLTIGYGDIVPIGIGRLIALIESLIGYILPTAFVLRLVQTRHNQEKR